MHNLANKISWSTLSKALEKSRRIASIWRRFERQLAKSLIVIISCETQLRNFRNPCCASSKTLCFSKCVIMLLCTTCSKTLQESEVKDMESVVFWEGFIPFFEKGNY